MKKWRIQFVVSTLLFISTSPLFAQKAGSPESVVSDLYRSAHIRPVARMSRQQLRKYFARTLADWIWKVANGENGIDFDVLYNAQDARITAFKVGKAEEFTRTSVTLSVTFKNFKQKETFEFALGSYAEGWRITDIIYTDGSRLSEILKP